MQNDNPGQESMRGATAGFAVLLLLAGAIAQGQIGPPASGANTVSSQESLTLARTRYDQAIRAELHNEAADASKLYINALLQDPNHDPKEWGLALGRLGEAQRYAGEFDAAIENYNLAVDVIESETNRLDPLLIEPLLGLSRTLEDSGNYRVAIASYQRLLHVQQVNQGLHSLEQGKALNELSEVYFRLGNFQRANALQHSYVSIYNNNFPGDNLLQLPALYSRADMQYKTGHMIDAQLSYRRIIAMIERADGRQSLYLLPAIYRINDLLQNNRIKDGIDGSYVARRYLRRAVYIAEKRDGASNLERADSRIAMGDYLSVRTDDRRAALRNYVVAWQQLNVDDTLSEECDARFGKPTLLNDLPAHTTPAMRRLMMLSQTALDDLPGRLAVRYDVDAEGRTRNIELIEGDPLGYWDSIVVDHVDGFIFRPAVIAGEPVESVNRLYEVRYSHQE
jgi:hypothetical protein